MKLAEMGRRWEEEKEEVAGLTSGMSSYICACEKRVNARQVRLS